MTAPTDIRIFRPKSVGLHTAVWRDWSCLVRLVVSDNTALDPAAAHLRALMNRVELAISRFRPDSELSRVNAAAGRTHTITPTFARLVDVALAEKDFSGGLVDPTLGSDLLRVGYDRDIAELARLAGSISMPETDPARRARSQVTLVGDQLTVTEGVALDLGATGKAHTADWAAREIAHRFGCDVLVEIGGDLALGGNPRDWQIAVSERAGIQAQQITLRFGGLATSTTTIRAWRRGEKRMHHLIDPRTGEPAEGPWRTASVAAATATRANTLTTAAIVSGADAVQLLRANGAAARLVAQDGTTFRVGDWPVPS